MVFDLPLSICSSLLLVTIPCQRSISVSFVLDLHWRHGCWEVAFLFVDASTLAYFIFVAYHNDDHVNRQQFRCR